MGGVEGPPIFVGFRAEPHVQHCVHGLISPTAFAPDIGDPSTPPMIPRSLRMTAFWEGACAFPLRPLRLCASAF